INVDFADVKTVMRDAGTALMGMGSGVGENRAQNAARSAIASPLLETSIEGAKGMLFNIIGGTDLTMSEVNQAAEIIAKTTDADANIIFGASIDESLVDQIKITVIATGFDETRQRLKDIATRTQVVQSQAQVTGADEEEDEPGKRPPDKDEEEKELSEAKEEPEDEFDIPAFLRQGR
ncbi:TPA: cell division protein FtsZ, partial [Candidatus Beckwithbacteria bacterium]|nr:cell division protein FtsZ [Candidatus Beckwithbacteria bacterium]